jgi:type III pantothenate kinase
LLLVVEIGNTTTSFAVFDSQTCLEVTKTQTSHLSDRQSVFLLISRLRETFPALRDAAFCSVVPGLNESVNEVLAEFLGGRIIRVSSAMRLPFRLHYDSPEAFGADRIALCAHSFLSYPGEAVIALDIGTAITVDVLSSEGEYLGGHIVPGLDLMARALHDYTAQLPLVNIGQPGALVGFSTAECIRNGIVWSCVSGIEGVVRKISSWLQEECQEKRIRVVATGGSAPLIASMLDITTELDEIAVLRGTRYLFEINTDSSC